VKTLIFVTLFPLAALAKPASIGAELIRHLHPDGQEIVTLECQAKCKVTREENGKVISTGEMTFKAAKAAAEKLIAEVPSRTIPESAKPAQSWKVWSGEKVSTGAISVDAASSKNDEIIKPALALGRFELSLTTALKPSH